MKVRDFLSWRGARGLIQGPALFLLYLANFVFSPPSGVIGAPGSRLSGGVLGARTSPRTMWRNPVSSQQEAGSS